MIITKQFPDKKGLYLGIVLLGFGLSPLISAPILQGLITQFDLHSTFLMMSGFSLVALLLLSLFFSKYTTKESNDRLEPFKETLKKPQFKLLYGVFFIGTFIGLTVIGFSSIYAFEVFNYSLREAAFFVSLFAIFNGMGRVVFGYLTDKFSLHNIMFLSFGLLLITSIVIVFFSNSLGVFIVSFSLIWMNLGGWLAIAPAATSKLFGQQSYTRNYGVLFSAYGMSAILGVYIAGLFSDLLGGYGPTFILFALLALLGMVMTYMLKRAFLNE